MLKISIPGDYIYTYVNKLSHNKEGAVSQAMQAEDHINHATSCNYHTWELPSSMSQ